MLVFLGFWYVGEDPAPAAFDGVSSSNAEQTDNADLAPAEEQLEQAEVLQDDIQETVEVASQEPAPEPEPVVPPEPVLDRLSMSFADACWVRVVDANGDEVYSGQRAAGASLAIQGQGPFRITLGNAAAVSEININGTVMPVPVSTPGRVVTVRTP